MANFNKVILAGNLTRDPQLSYTQSNTAVCQFGLAINRRWRGQDGNQQEETCFVDCTAFGRQGEVINQYMTKGQPILVEGRLNFSQWSTPEGEKRSKLKVIVEGFQFLGGRGAAPDEGSGAEQGSTGAAPPATASSPPRPAAPRGTRPPPVAPRQPEDADAPPGDDIPF